jgi:hypothetical protein
MPAPISSIESLARLRLKEVTPRYWTSQELTDICIAGIRDLWRDIVNLKQEHFLTINNKDVFFDANSTQLRGLPKDIHKVYMIEALDLSETSVNVGLQFRPLEYNHKLFQYARSMAPIDPVNDTIWFSIAAAGGPVDGTTIYCAPQVTSVVPISFSYVPTIPDLNTNSNIPIPGEATNALVAYTVAFARATERDDRAPDPQWLAIYATEKNNILESLGLRQYQEPKFGDAIFEEYWG